MWSELVWNQIYKKNINISNVWLEQTSDQLSIEQMHETYILYTYFHMWLHDVDLFGRFIETCNYSTTRNTNSIAPRKYPFQYGFQKDTTLLFSGIIENLGVNYSPNTVPPCRSIRRLSSSLIVFPSRRSYVNQPCRVSDLTDLSWPRLHDSRI